MASEKVSFNISVADLGKISMLVDKGIYTSRTDFITKAVLNELNKNDDIIEEEKKRFNWSLGISGIKIEDVLNAKAKNEKMTVYNIGLLVIDQEITLDLAKDTIKSITNHGKVIASDEIKKHYGL